MQFCYTERLKGINYELWAGMGGHREDLSRYINLANV